MNTLKKTVVTACAIATISFAALGATSTGASAGWKKHRHHHHFHGRFFKPHHYGYNSQRQQRETSGKSRKMV